MALERYLVRERGRLQNPEALMLTPHDLAFPAVMSTLAIFMGLPVRTGTSRSHGMQWLDLFDHYVQAGISAEGFCMLYDLPHGILRENLFDGAPLRDCFAFFGLPCRLYADASVAVKDRELHRPQDFIDVVAGHIPGNLPAIVLTKENRLILATGYENYGKTLRGWVFADRADNTNKSFDAELCQCIDQWAEAAFAVITVGEPGQVHNKKDIFLRALERGYALLTAENKSGYGTEIYKNWMRVLCDDGKFMGDVSGRPHIDPEIWDLAERRAWTAHFMRDAQAVIGGRALDGAIEAFNAIHDKMWELNRLCSGNNCVKLRDRLTRQKIMDIVKACALLDIKAAECIKKTVDAR